MSLVSAVAAAQGSGKTNESYELFYFRPNTPERLVRGAILAERLERPDLARGYLEELVASQPSVDVLLGLRTNFGIGAFLKLSSIEQLQPASRELLSLINEATRKEAPSASTVKLLITELGQSKQQTLAAGIRILAAGNAAVPPLLAADQSTREGKLAADLLSRDARRFRLGLLAAMPDADDAGKVRILKMLGNTAAPSIVPDLLKYRFSDSPAVADAAASASTRLLLKESPLQTKADAVAFLTDRALEFTSLAATPFPDEQDRLTERDLAREFDPTADLTLFGKLLLQRAVTLAEDAVALAPENDKAVATLQVCELAEQSWPARWPTDWQVPTYSGEPDQKPAASTVAALQLALDTGNPAAILPMLAESNVAIPLLMQEKTLLRRCQLAADPRIRLMTATLEAAVGATGMYSKRQLKVASKRVSRPEAVIIDSRDGESASAAAVVSLLKIAATPATSGTLGFEAATQQLRCELVLVHSNCLYWNLSDTIANLRTDYRTQTTPIVIYGPERDEVRTEAIRSAHDGVWFIPAPVSEYTLADTLRLSDVTPPLLTEEERVAMFDLARSMR